MAVVLAAGMPGCQRQPDLSQSQRAADSAKLQRAINLEEWGFHEAALHWYEKLSKPPIATEIQRYAMGRWSNVLLWQGERAARLKVLEKTLRNFPQEGKMLRLEIFRVYLDAWAWPQALAMGKEILASDAPENIDTWRRTLDFCARREKQRPFWQETFDAPQALAGWVIDCPGQYRVNTIRRELEANLTAGSRTRAAKEFTWKGDSISLHWDMRIQQLEWAAELWFGIFSSEREEDLLVKFNCIGGSGDLLYVVALDSKVPGTVVRGSNYRYTPGIPYRMELDYVRLPQQLSNSHLPQGSMAALRIYNHDKTDRVGEQVVHFATGLPPGRYMAGVASIHTGGGNQNCALICVDNMELLGESWK